MQIDREYLEKTLAECERQEGESLAAANAAAGAVRLCRYLLARLAEPLDRDASEDPKQEQT